MTVRRWSGVVIVVVLAGGCTDGDAGQPSSSGPDSSTVTEPTDTSNTSNTSNTLFPDIVAVEATQADDGTWSFAVTVSSPYDTPEQYADGWRVVGADGEVFGVHQLMHDHASEQPFTRRQTGVEIPATITDVTIEGRDLLNGYGGTSLTITLEPTT